MIHNRLRRLSSLSLAVIASIAIVSPAVATSSHTFPGTGGKFDTEVTTSNTWSIGTGGGLSGQRMLIDMGGTNVVTIRVTGLVASVPLNMSNAECSWEANSTVTTLVLGGNTSATLASAPTAGYVDCTLTRQTIIGSQFYVRIPGSPTRISADILFYLSNYGSGGSSGTPRPAAPAAKYSGPEFSSFGSAVLAGTKLVASGKKLDAITSMKINGTGVTYKINSASELEIDLPKDLAPGKYDVEINSIHGKLTHLQGITIKAVVPTKELAFKAEGAWLNYGSLLELTNIAKKIGTEYTSVKCIANAADPVVAERLAKRACSYIEANRLRGKAVTYESKSTYKGEGFWVRVVANG